MDAICDGERVLIPGIMEHIERAGVHSGDSIAVYPPQRLSEELRKTIEDYTIRVAQGLNTVGLVNIQFVISYGRVYIIEVNPRSSRTIPFLSKVTAIPMAKLAMKGILGLSLKEAGYTTGLVDDQDGVYVKMPVFSFNKLKQVDTVLGPEMKSTGEAIGKDINLPKALYKGFVASGVRVPAYGAVLMTVADKDKEEATAIAKRFARAGYRLIATKGTAQTLEGAGLEVETIDKINANNNAILDAIHNGRINLVVNTMTTGQTSETDGFLIRRETVENNIPCLTSLDTAEALLQAVETTHFQLEDMSKA